LESGLGAGICSTTVPSVATRWSWAEDEKLWLTQKWLPSHVTPVGVKPMARGVEPSTAPPSGSIWRMRGSDEERTITQSEPSW
jgi:hypothetical protein